MFIKQYSLLKKNWSQSIPNSLSVRALSHQSHKYQPGRVKTAAHAVMGTA